MTTTPVPHPRFRARFNGPLIIGSLLVGLVIYLALIGPDIAPYDPLAENVILKDSVTGEWHMPPFKAFEVTGYPLGSDEFGRDLYSRLLWAIRPTLQMVAVVAAVRMVLGTLIGLAAGWSTGRVGRFLDSLISGALALPGLLVALGTIAVVGVELGLLAFVIGLSVTGWAETARIVREQTRMIKSQIYIEAAHALGASASEIVSRHILRQIQAMLLMLLAFEISATLMLTAGLGFLGYYIGGDVWVDVSDFVARRTSGSPELGQMLATAWVRLTDPWGLVSVGSVVFALVLGFNLIGKGLRLRLSHEVQSGIIRWLGERLAGVFLLVEHHITYPIGKLMARPVPFAVFRLGLGMVVGATAVWGWDQGWFKLPDAEVAFLFADNFSQTALPDQGSAATPTPQTQVISVNPLDASPTPSAGEGVHTGSAWVYNAPEPLMSEPLFGPEGTVALLGESETMYLLSAEGTLRATITLPTPLYWFEENGEGAYPLLPSLMADGSVLVVSEGQVYALNPDGSLRWEFPMDRPPYDFPSFDETSGRWYLLDDLATLYAFTPAEGLLWTHDLEEGLKTASPLPVFGLHGEIFYTITNGTSAMVEALSSDGTQTWRTNLTTFKFYRYLEITQDGQWLMVDDNLVNTSTGQLLETDDLGFDILETTMGYDGKQYLIAGTTVMEWEVAESGTNGIKIVHQASVAFPQTTQRGAVPQLSVSKEGIYWIQLFSGQGRLRINMWVNAQAEILGIVNVDTEVEQILDIDEENGRLTVCASNVEAHRLECRGYDGRSSNPVWQVNIEGIGVFDYYFYANGRLYIQVDEDTVQVVEFVLP